MSKKTVDDGTPIDALLDSDHGYPNGSLTIGEAARLLGVNKDSGHYTVNYYCTNCGQSVKVRFKKGECSIGHVYNGECPNCGCSKSAGTAWFSRTQLADI